MRRPGVRECAGLGAGHGGNPQSADMKKAPTGAFFPPTEVRAAPREVPMMEAAMLKLTGSSLLRELLHLGPGLLITGFSATSSRRLMFRVGCLGLTGPGQTSGFLAPCRNRLSRS